VVVDLQNFAAGSYVSQCRGMAVWRGGRGDSDELVQAHARHGVSLAPRAAVPSCFRARLQVQRRRTGVKSAAILYSRELQRMTTTTTIWLRRFLPAAYR
jgi:hypothetical protein